MLYRFNGGADGGVPNSSLIEDNKGNLFSTTSYGGEESDGTVFEITAAGKEKVLYSFNGGVSDGRFPYSPFVRDPAGNFYGTTTEGGKTDCSDGGAGCGTVYRLSNDGKETVLYAFQGVPDGSDPFGQIVIDKAGNLYGSTYTGGISGGSCPPAGCGTVFKVGPDGTETVMHSFDGTDGEFPRSGLITDKSGNLYGTAEYGGTHDDGVVFKVAPDGTETTLHNFGGTDGKNPASGLFVDAKGNLYGTTEYGGVRDRGVVFKIEPTGTETVLHSLACKNDGCEPQGSLIGDKGYLYGTAFKKGPSACSQAGKPRGCGTVFKVKDNWEWRTR